MKTLPLAFILLLAACATAPLPPPGHDVARPAQPTGPLSAVEARLRRHAGENESGFRLLNSADDGLRYRLALIDSARHTLDVQTFLWWADDSGNLILKHLFDAADRGVKVRFLIDDLTTISPDGVHIALRDRANAIVGAHPNIELRVFNPWGERPLVGRGLEFIGAHDKLNHRMHNKVIVADNRVMITGGRNLGNEYLGLSPIFNFRDLDVLGVGPVARQGSALFDSFWNSEWVATARSLDKSKEPATLADVTDLTAALTHSLESSPALVKFTLAPKNWSAELEALDAQLHVGTSQLFSDSPDAEEITHHMPEHVRALFGAAVHEVLIENAYIIPGDNAFKRTAEQIKKGVHFRYLTNSLASNDVPAVNSQYKKWRKPLLEAGVELHEIRSDAKIKPLAENAPVVGEFMGLHVKAIVVDRKRVMLGSMNLDPRSWDTNSEMGLLIESPGFANEVAKVIENDMQPENAWLLSLDEKGHVRWTSGDQVLDQQPARNVGQRIEDAVMMLLPRDMN